MLFAFVCAKILVLLVCSIPVKGTCPYIPLPNDNLSREVDILRISDDYMQRSSYATTYTDCFRFVSQPPVISDSVMDNALNISISRTDRYIVLDIASSEDVTGPKKFMLMDRNSYYFESVTRYIQWAGCASKKTTTFDLSRLQIEKFESYMKKDVTKVACEAGHVRYPKCSGRYPYRSFDGTCNNLKRPLDGRARDCMLRLLPPDYKDGIRQFRTSVDGSPLPNARFLSTQLLGGDDKRPFSTKYTDFHTFLGELVISDNGMTLSHDAGIRTLVSCDDKYILLADHPQCAGIAIPPNDTIHQIYPDQKCMPFTRTIPCARCRPGPRLLSSSVTAAQDLNSVYGVTKEMSNARRTMVGGGLKSQIIKGEEVFAVERFNASGRFRCFEGECELSPFDGRNVQLPTGQMFALLFHRNHNWHARRLSKIKPNWCDEQIFQEARRWNIAEYQHCIFNEYVKTLIGNDLADKFEIQPKVVGQFSVYKPRTELKTVIEFQSAAGRNAHTTLDEDIHIIDPETGKKSKVNMKDSAKAESIFYEGQVDGVILAKISRPAFETTPSVPFKTFLYNLPGRKFGLDLGALDTHRQRDHGIPGYIYYIEFCQNVTIRRWKDLKQFMDHKDIEKLKKFYKYVEDIDLYIGGRYERKLPDALVGPTFGCIIAKQFYNVKYGDRFFYEHGNQVGSFSIKQLNEIKAKTNLASILCKTTKLKRVPRNPLRLLSETNPFVDCSQFDCIDYKLGVRDK